MHSSIDFIFALSIFLAIWGILIRGAGMVGPQESAEAPSSYKGRIPFQKIQKYAHLSSPLIKDAIKQNSRTLLVFRLLKATLTYFMVIGSLAPIFYLLQFCGVLAADETFAMAFMTKSASTVLVMQGGLSAALVSKLADAVGMTPAKNFANLVRLVGDNADGHRAIFWAFALSHYSANPAVWKRIIKAIPATDLAFDPATFDSLKSRMPAYPDLTGTGTAVVFFWGKASATTPTGQFRTSSILGSNPTFAAYTWIVVMPNSENTYEKFVAQRWACACYVDAATVGADCENSQKKFVTETLGLPWKSAFYKTMSSSNFYIPAMIQAATVPQPRSHKATVMMVADVVDWLNVSTGRSATGTGDMALLTVPAARIPPYVTLKPGSS